MPRQLFSLLDFKKTCLFEEKPYELDGKKIGLRIHVPVELQDKAPFNASAYDFLQFFRAEIQHYRFIELPGLKLNKSNYTLAQRAPQEHAYSSNHYMTDRCQMPHQDTPPYPTAFWLEKRRQYFFTWLMGIKGVEHVEQYQQQHPFKTIDEVHQVLVPQSLEQGWGLIVNQQAGLILIDNHQHQALYHARSCNFDAIRQHPGFETDTPMYAFNEVGLLHYIDQLDSRRGSADRDSIEQKAITEFMQQEQLR